jgi:hypothetical protein
LRSWFAPGRRAELAGIPGRLVGVGIGRPGSRRATVVLSVVILVLVVIVCVCVYVCVEVLHAVEYLVSGRIGQRVHNPAVGEKNDFVGI